MPSLAAISSLSPPAARDALPRWAAAHVDPSIAAAAAARVGRALETVPDAALAALVEGYAQLGERWDFYPANPAARAMMRMMMEEVVPSHALAGEAELAAFAGGAPRRRLIVCNHLSYVDTQVTDAVLARAGFRELADRIVAVAGPKVYTDAWRRLAALGLHTRKTVQSASVATDQATLPPRELAAIALDTLRSCMSLMDEGYVVLLYPEGTRSRDGRLQPFLRAVGRYLSAEGVHVLPMAQTGTEDIFPREALTMRPGAVRLAFGEELPPLEDRQAQLQATHAAIAGLLPPAYAPPPESLAVV
jgi:1-acyl-sn-glycerol-3-phosphate acyltransferase